MFISTRKSHAIRFVTLLMMSLSVHLGPVKSWKLGLGISLSEPNDGPICESPHGDPSDL